MSSLRYLGPNNGNYQYKVGAPIIGLLEVHDLPVLLDGPAGRRSVNAPLLASIIFASHSDQAFVESVNARPGEGPTGASKASLPPLVSLPRLYYDISTSRYF
jgi:hypothetical protein